MTLEQTITSIRNILRSEGITGLDSVNHCVLFMVCRLLNADLCSKVGIDDRFAFENLCVDEDGELEAQELYDKFYKKSGKDDFVGQIVNKLKFRNIKFKLEGPQNLVKIIEKIKKLDVNKLSADCDIIGTIYEIHLKSGSSNSMRDLGQYYTNRNVIKYMIELCDPKMVGKKIETIMDPTVGTGGFLTMAAKYLDKKYKVDWAQNKDRIMGFDIDENVKNMALINMFLETGEFFSDTILKRDSLKSDLKISGVDIILANEPMGIKNLKYEECCERIKDFGIKCSIAELLFLQLVMSTLKTNGRCAIIVPDGVLFNERPQYVKTRKYLVENFELKKVISLADDFFLNTSVKTSILFFENSGYQTDEVEFSKIFLKDGKIKKEIIMTSSIEQDTFSFFVEKYNVKKEERVEGMRYEKISSVCNINYGTRIKKSEEECPEDYQGKKYPCYGGGDISFYMKKFNREGFSILISRFGISKKCVRLIDTKFWLNDSGFTIVPKDEKVLNVKYLGYYFLLKMQDRIYNMARGACQKNLQMDHFKNFEIPIPPLVEQQKFVKYYENYKVKIGAMKKKMEEEIKKAEEEMYLLLT